ncbi:MerR family transcriptional regulator [Gorillibacterium sp. CAU 1737]|uniref:helix-turn-helix domain-containing protein n=1 Tax=Gorillibacterium sp. CAU 1737 TaxID=3140362 RepID=UPI0032617ECF
MKKEITISELARLMKVSVHQIRYFEEKGILLPAYIDDNQYRMYGIEQIYRLSHILLLRKLGLSVSSIRDCLSQYGPKDYRRLLQASLMETRREIARLRDLELFTEKVLAEEQEMGVEKPHFDLKEQKAVPLRILAEVDTGTPFDARTLLRYADGQDITFDSDLHYMQMTDDRAWIAVETEEAQADFTLPVGTYLSYHFLATEDDLEHFLTEYETYAAEHDISLQKPTVLIEKTYLSLFHKDKLHYEIRMHVLSDEHRKEASPT